MIIIQLLSSLDKKLYKYNRERKMKLISEEITSAEMLVEETNEKKDYKIKGVFLQSNIKNRNGRIYPKEIF